MSMQRAGSKDFAVQDHKDYTKTTEDDHARGYSAPVDPGPEYVPVQNNTVGYAGGRGMVGGMLDGSTPKTAPAPAPMRQRLQPVPAAPIDDPAHHPFIPNGTSSPNDKGGLTNDWVHRIASNPERYGLSSSQNAIPTTARGNMADNMTEEQRAVDAANTVLGIGKDVNNMTNYFA